MKIFKKFLMASLSISLASACQSTSNRKALDGLLIKQQNLKKFSNRNVWLSDFKIKDQQLSSALMALGKNDWKKSIEFTKNFLKSHPFHTGSFLILASAYNALGQHEMSRYYAQRVLERHPGNIAALNLVGLSIYVNSDLLEDYRKAVSYFTTAFEKSPKEIASGLNLAYLFLELGNASRAEKIFNAVSKKCGGCEESQLGRAISYGRQGKAVRAKNILEELVKQNPQLMTANYQLALYYRNVEKNYDKSSYYLKRILSQNEILDLELMEKARLLWYANREFHSL